MSSKQQKISNKHSSIITDGTVQHLQRHRMNPLAHVQGENASDRAELNF